MKFFKFLFIGTFFICLFLLTQKSLRYSVGDFIIRSPLNNYLPFFYKRPFVPGVEVISHRGEAHLIQKNILMPLKNKFYGDQKLTIQTGQDSFVLLRFGHNSLLKILSHSTFNIQVPTSKKRKKLLQLPFGAVFMSVANEGDKIILQTPFAEVRGRLVDYFVQTGNLGKTTMAVLDGEVIAKVVWDENQFFIRKGEGSAVDIKGHKLTPRPYGWVQKLKWSQLTKHMHVDDFQWKIDAIKKGTGSKMSAFEYDTFRFVSVLKEGYSSGSVEFNEYLRRVKRSEKKMPTKKSQKDHKKSGARPKGAATGLYQAINAKKKMDDYYKKMEEDFLKD